MIKLMKKKTFWLSAAALVMAGSLSLNSAMAYFTTYVAARGGHSVTLGSETSVTEEFSDWTKHISIQNTGDTDCFIRVKVFAGSQFGLSFSDANGKWSAGDEDYLYYSDPVAPGESAQELLAQITVPDSYTESFNVTVVQECTPVLYNGDGSAYPDWDIIADKTSGIGTIDGKGAEE